MAVAKNSRAFTAGFTRRAKPKFPGRDHLPILGHGNQRFVDNVNRVLEEAERYHPAAHQDALAFLPTAEWAPDNPRFSGNIVAFSDGIFRCGGESDAYEDFRSTFWHEVGHNVDEDISGSAEGEARADIYAAEVIEQIEQAKGQEQSRPLTRLPPKLLPAPLPRAPVLVNSRSSIGQRIFARIQPTDHSIWRSVGAGEV